MECLCGTVAGILILFFGLFVLYIYYRQFFIFIHLGMYSYENLLHPDIFVSARFIESELVKMGIELFHGAKEGACGITTTGGTESSRLKHSAIAGNAKDRL